ncbi:MAG: SIMPL domain-containing protein [Halodesulfurarchaeum sp.]|nr:SIMPL domain-containing protein [Halodesulfurarchaeum sp.]
MDRGTILAVAIAVAVIAGAGTAGVAMAFSDQNASPNQTTDIDKPAPNSTITVSATGSESADPDKAELRIVVQKTADDPNTARTDVANNVSSVTEALLAMGLADEDIRTTDYRIGERVERPTGPTEERTEERVAYARQTLEVEITDLDQVGSAIDTAVESGATEVQNVRYTLTEQTRNELRNEALVAAMEQARSQADTLATQSELTITGPSEITTDSYHSPIVRYETAAGGVAESSTEIDAGPVSVQTQVTVTYEAAP